MRAVTNMAAALVLAAGVAAAPADAATMKAVYEGVITSSTDQDGSWGNGTGIGALNGLAILAEVIFDPDLGDRTTGNFGGSDVDIVYGGTSNGAPDFMSSVMITINNVTRAVNFAYAQQAQVVDDNVFYSQHSLLAYDVLFGSNGGYSDSSYFQASVNDPSGVIPVDLENPFLWDALTATYTSNGYFEFYDLYDPFNGFTNYSSGSFTITKATFSRVDAPVPLPASAFLLLGAGGALAMVRRRRRAG